MNFSFLLFTSESNFWYSKKELLELMSLFSLNIFFTKNKKEITEQDLIIKIN